MIYSDDINKICALCQFLKIDSPDEDEAFCKKYNKNVELSQDACKKFLYDILKKPVRRKRKLNTEFSEEDFKL